MNTGDIPLFEKFPGLKSSLPRIPLGNLPTPVTVHAGLAQKLNVDRFYIKRDDKSGMPYGGNKVRKLEFLLGDAIAKRKKKVITFGYAGSNHALATGIYARLLGLSAASMLLEQSNSPYVRKNLILSLHAGIELHHYRSMSGIAAGTIVLVLASMITGMSIPYIIPAGGSSLAGCTGFVNAGFELAEQIRSGGIDEPDVIYVALGTMGTAAGLLLGLKAAGLRSRLVPVRVVDRDFSNEKKLISLYRRLNSFLRSFDPSFPECPLREEECTVCHDCFGEGYGMATPESREAVELLAADGILLETTYTGKAMAALIRDARSGKFSPGSRVMFWNTMSSAPLPDGFSSLDFRDLPKPFRRYFTEKPNDLTPEQFK